MDNEQVSLAKEILERKKEILQESLKLKKGQKLDLPVWLIDLGPTARKRMLQEVIAALERVESDDYGYCQSCFQEIPWAEIARIPERDLCDMCITRRRIMESLAAKNKRAAKRRKAAAKRQAEQRRKATVKKKGKPAKKKAAAKKKAKPAKKKTAAGKKVKPAKKKAAASKKAKLAKKNAATKKKAKPAKKSPSRKVVKKK